MYRVNAAEASSPRRAAVSAGVSWGEAQSELAATALRHLPFGVAILGVDGTVLYANDACRAFFGCADNGLLSLLEAPGTREHGVDREIALPDGRTARARFSAIPEGTLVTLDDMTRPAGEARPDPTTSLGTRSDLNVTLGTVLAGRPTEQAALLCVSLDRFKIIGETLGHAVGDALLRAVADRLRSITTDRDMLARLGGDTFAVLQRGDGQPAAAAALAARVVDLIGRTYLLEGHLINIGAHIGIALLRRDGGDPERIVKNAAIASHCARQETAGFCFFSPEMDAAIAERRELELALGRALALRQLQLFYQPQVSLALGDVTGFEALLRWQHPTRGFISPAAFIPLAEETGTIVPIGEWVIRTATREAASWPNDLRVAVNVSPLQFASPKLVATVMSALAESGLAPHRLELEITESVLLEDRGSTLDMLHQLRALGVRVSMDDFGTGYSSLSTLRRFPFDKIKIDQSFIRGARDPSTMAIVRAIAALGQSLGLSTTAEGVEDIEMLDQVAAQGCTDVQGYFISRPMPADAVGAFLAGGTSHIARPRGTEPQ